MVVSIVIPLYNKEQWIEQTLLTVVQQTFPLSRMELIIVDDGSTDSGPQQAAALLAKHPLRHEIIKVKNGGPSRARNIGWKRARAEWIQFLDADDLLLPRKIEVQASRAIQAPSSVAIVYSAWRRLDQMHGDSDHCVGRYCDPQIGSDAAVNLLKSENFIATGSQLFRRDWLEKVSGYQEHLWLIEDVDLLLRIALKGGQFVSVSTGEALFCYRTSRQSLSRCDPCDFMEACVRNAQLAENHWLCQGGLTPPQKALLADIYFSAAHFFAIQNWRRFRAIAKKLEDLASPFLPAGPPYLRLLSRLAGYEGAERIAVLPRRIKHRLKRLSSF